MSMWFKPKPKAESKKSDAVLRQRLMGKIKRQQLESESKPIVSLSDFFVGNEDFGSIGCNLNPMLGPQLFYEQLQSILSQPAVQDVLIEISDTNENDPDPLMWPFSDQIYILTTAAYEDISKWLAPLQPDEIEATHINDRVQEIALNKGVKIYRAWWD